MHPVAFCFAHLWDLVHRMEMLHTRPIAVPGADGRTLTSFDPFIIKGVSAALSVAPAADTPLILKVCLTVHQVPRSGRSCTRLRLGLFFAFFPGLAI